MSIPVHRKKLSCCEINEQFVRGSYKRPTHLTTKLQFKKLASTQNVPTMRLQKDNTFKFRNHSYNKHLTNIHTNLPTKGYLITSIKAPNVNAITATIKEKLNKSRLQNANVEKEKASKECLEDIKMKSIELQRANVPDDDNHDNHDERLKAIINSNPNKVLQERKNNTIYLKANQLINGLREIDYEDETIRRQIELAELKTELQEIQIKEKSFSEDHVLKNLHKQAVSKKLKEDKYYKFVKDPRTQLLQRRVLNTSDCVIFSKLYMVNTNPLLQINEMVSLPYILNDANLLANVQHVNMYRLKNMRANFIKS
jgi:hypothetical protein